MVRASSNVRHCIVALLSVTLAILSGCAEVATTVWSPDGKRAAYAAQGKGHLIDADGKVLAPLGNALGAFAWSSDSTTLLHARKKLTKDAKPLTPAVLSWLPHPVDPQSAPQFDPAAERDIVARTADDKTEDLFDVPGSVLLLRLSPDGAFLAATVTNDTDKDTFRLYVYSTASKTLYLLDDVAGLPIDFTADGKLLHLSVDRDNDAKDVSQLVEVTLAPELPDAPKRVPLVSVLSRKTVWLQRAGNTILFTTRRATFPTAAIAEDDGDGDDKFDLFAFTPADKKLIAIAEDVGALFSVSPDGNRVLVERAPKDTQPGGLVLMNANGSSSQVLRPYGKLDSKPAFPAWRGNGELSYFSPDKVATSTDDQGNTKWYYDLVLYSVEDGKTLAPVKTLSTDWPNDMRPVAPGPKVAAEQK